MYIFTQNDLLENPITYQFSDVSSKDFLKEYEKQRKSFLKSYKNNRIELSLDEKFLTNDELVFYQKKFEVKKIFFDSKKDNISFMTHLSFNLANRLKKELCLSLFSTLLKINDTLTSTDIELFSLRELSQLIYSIEIELEIFKEVNND